MSILPYSFRSVRSSQRAEIRMEQSFTQSSLHSGIQEAWRQGIKGGLLIP